MKLHSLSIAGKWLRVLALSGLQLKEIPPEIGRLTEILELDLSNNALNDLPMELQNLKKIRVLRLKGKRFDFYWELFTHS